MLLPDNIHPDNSIYYNASFVLQILQTQKTQKLFDLYQKVKEKQNMSFSIFLLSIDWLYLLDLVILKESGEIQLCF